MKVNRWESIGIFVSDGIPKLSKKSLFLTLGELLLFLLKTQNDPRSFSIYYLTGYSFFLSIGCYTASPSIVVFKSELADYAIDLFAMFSIEG
jgi:hypothetical protein